MSTAAHSPLPFGEPMLQDESGVYQVRDANGQRTACVYSASDAAFVRRACNNHEALLAACKAVMDDLAPALVDDIRLGEIAVLQQVRAAIKLAEAE